MSKVLLVLVGLLLLTGCSKNVATCWTQGDGGNVHASFGYFYDSAEVTSTGPAVWKRIPKGFTYDPCAGPPPEMETP